MAYEVEYPWKRNPRLVKLAFWADVLESDVLNGLEDVAYIMDHAMMPIQVVIDFRHMEQSPSNLLDLFKKNRMIYHQQQGYCLFLEAGRFIRFIAQVLTHEAKLRVEFQEDEANAWNFFSEMGFC
jgi:hypothetical protein